VSALHSIGFARARARACCVCANVTVNGCVCVCVCVCGEWMCVYLCARVCTAPGSPARGPRSPFAVSRPPNYLPLRSELNESRRVTVAIRRVSPPRQSPPDGAGGGRREGRKRTIARTRRARQAMERNERRESGITAGGREGDWAGGGGRRQEKLAKFYQAIFLTRNG